MTSYSNNQGNPAGAIPVYLGAANYTHINAAGSTQALSGAGVLMGVTINTGASGATVALYDGTSTAGKEIAVISAEAPGGLSYGVPVAAGLFVVVTGSPDITIRHS